MCSSPSFFHNPPPRIEGGFFDTQQYVIVDSFVDNHLHPHAFCTLPYLAISIRFFSLFFLLSLRCLFVCLRRKCGGRWGGEGGMAISRGEMRGILTELEAIIQQDKRRLQCLRKQGLSDWDSVAVAHCLPALNLQYIHIALSSRWLQT